MQPLKLIKNRFVSKLCRSAKKVKGFSFLKPFTGNALPSGLEPETL